MITNSIIDVFSKLWFIEPSKTQAYLPFVLSLLEGKLISEITNNTDYGVLRAKHLPKVYATNNQIINTEENANINQPETIITKNIAVLNISGIITKNSELCTYGTIDYLQWFKQYEADDTIGCIVLQFDSPGGEGYGTRTLAQYINASKKPTIAFIDDNCASAAFWIAAACDKIYCNNDMAKAGSIGVFTTFQNFTEFYEKQGIKIQEIYAQQSINKNIEYKELLKGNTTLIENELTTFCNFFINDIKQFRSEKNLNEKVFEGNYFFANEAKYMGLIDDIKTFDEVLSNAFLIANPPATINNPQFSNPNNPTTMNFKKTWLALISLFNFASNIEETPLKEEHLNTINAKLAELTTTNQQLNLANKVLQDQVDESASELNTMKITVANLTAKEQQLTEQLAKRPGTATGNPPASNDNQFTNENCFVDPITAKAIELFNQLSE